MEKKNTSLTIEYAHSSNAELTTELTNASIQLHQLGINIRLADLIITAPAIAQIEADTSELSTQNLITAITHFQPEFTDTSNPELDRTLTNITEIWNLLIRREADLEEILIQLDRE